MYLIFKNYQQFYTSGTWFRLVLTRKVDNLNNIHSYGKHVCEGWLGQYKKNLYNHFTFSVLWSTSKQGELIK